MCVNNMVGPDKLVISEQWCFELLSSRDYCVCHNYAVKTRLTRKRSGCVELAQKATVRSKTAEFCDSCAVTDCYAVINEVCCAGIGVCRHNESVCGRRRFLLASCSDHQSVTACGDSGEHYC